MKQTIFPLPFPILSQWKIMNSYFVIFKRFYQFFNEVTSYVVDTLEKYSYISISNFMVTD